MRLIKACAQKTNAQKGVHPKKRALKIVYAQKIVRFEKLASLAFLSESSTLGWPSGVSSVSSHLSLFLDWISAKSTGAISDVGATSSGTASASITASEATEHLQILSTKITSSFMSRELHQQTLDRYLNLARAEHQSNCLLFYSSI